MVLPAPTWTYLEILYVLSFRGSESKSRFPSRWAPFFVAGCSFPSNLQWLRSDIFVMKYMARFPWIFLLFAEKNKLSEHLRFSVQKNEAKGCGLIK